MVDDVIIRNDLIKRLSDELGVIENEVIGRFAELKSNRRYNKKNEKDKKNQIKHYDSKSDKAQFEILKLFIHNQKLSKDISLSLFDNKLCYNIVKTIIDNSNRYKNVAQLLEYLGNAPEERNLVASLAVDVPDKENELNILSDCIETLENQKIKNKISKLRNQIRINEESGEITSEEMVLELIALQKKTSK